MQCHCRHDITAHEWGGGECGERGCECAAFRPIVLRPVGCSRDDDPSQHDARVCAKCNRPVSAHPTGMDWTHDPLTRDGYVSLPREPRPRGWVARALSGTLPAKVY